MGSTIWWLLLYFVILLYGNLGFKVMVDSGCPKSKPPNPQSKPPDIVNLWYLVILDLLIRGAQKVKKTIHYIYIYIYIYYIDSLSILGKFKRQITDSTKPGNPVDPQVSSINGHFLGGHIPRNLGLKHRPYKNMGLVHPMNGFLKWPVIIQLVPKKHSKYVNIL